MKLREFTYKKEGGAIKRYACMVLNETPEDMSGISVGELPPADQLKIIEAVRAFETALNPYMGQFRKFSKGKVIDLLKETK